MLKIGLAQLLVEPGNARGNVTRMKEYIREAITKNCDLIIFPELCIPGYFIGDNWDQTDYMNECISLGEEIRTLSENITVIFGNVALEKEKINPDGRIRKYNAMFIAQNGKFIAPGRSPYPFYIKTLLPDYREFDDLRYFTSLTEVATERHAFPEDFLSPLHLTFKNGDELLIGPLICEDSWDENYAVKPMSYLNDSYDIDLYVNISNSPFTLGKPERRHRLFGHSLNRFKKPAVYVNCTGVQNNGKNIYTFDGSATAYNNDGSLFYEGIPYTNELVVLTFDPDTRSFTGTKSVSSQRSETASIYEALHYGIQKFTEQAGIRRVIIGVSGGIDSAVNAALYATVFKPEDMLLVNMPSTYNSQMTKSLAEESAKNIGCTYAVIPVQDSLELTRNQFLQMNLTRNGEVLSPLTLTPFMEENVQARDRSSRILAATAAAFGGAFTCNANKAEMTVGYATLYGDGAGFLAATADLWKHQVYDLAHYLNTEVFGREVVPQGSIDIIPSAELSAAQDITKGQGDPLIYPYHDYLFSSFVERWQRATPETILRWYDEGTLEENLHTPLCITDIFPGPSEFIADLERWWNLFSGFAVAKRIQSPPMVAISRRAFGNDLRESQIRPYYTQEYERLKKKLLQ